MKSLRLSACLKSLYILLLFGLFGLFASPAAAQTENEDLLIVLEAGFDQIYVEDQWLPVNITLANEGPSADGYVKLTMGINDNTIEYRQTLSLANQSLKEITMYVFPEVSVGRMVVEYFDGDDDLIASETFRPGLQLARNNELFYGVVSDEVVELVELDSISGPRVAAEIAYLQIEQLPDFAMGLQALDVLIFTNVDSTRLTPSQRTAITAWVETGGQIVVTGGVSSALNANAFSDLLPVTLGQNETLTNLPDLSAEIGRAIAVDSPVLVTTSQLRRGEALVSEGAIPLLVQEKQGLGNVFFVAFDPALEPMLDRNVAEFLWEQVADSASQNDLLSNLAFDQYGSVQAATIFPQLEPPSVFTLLSFLLVYILVIGPINYLVLRRIGRREWAWISIPLIIISFLGIAYFAGLSLRGRRVLTNQVAVAYGATDSETMRVESILGLYSPVRQTYDVRFEKDVLPYWVDSRFSYNSSSDANLAFTEIGQENVIKDLRISVADVETLRTSTIRPMPALTGEAVLSDGSNELIITLFNDSNLDLEHASIYLGSSAVYLGEIPAGETFEKTVTLAGTSYSRAQQLAAGLNPRLNVNLGSVDLQSVHNIMLDGTSGYRYCWNDLDAELYQRCQLIEGTIGYGSYASSGPPSINLPTKRLVVSAWSNEAFVDVQIDNENESSSAVTLMFIEMPFSVGQ